MTIAASVLPVVIIMLITMVIQDNMVKKSGEELNDLASINIDQVANDAYSICQTSHDLFMMKNNVSINLLKRELLKDGGLNFSTEKIEWKITNQFSGESSNVLLPKIIINGKWIGKNYTFSDTSTFIDKVVELAGGTITLFQKINDNGDMLRFATNVPNSNGQRAIGTLIPAFNPDGKKNEVISTILKGKRYDGITYVVNDWYVSTYEPYYDKDSNIVGMIYVGEKLSSLNTLKSALMNMNIGKNGYIYVLGTVAPHKDKFIWSRKGLDNGKNAIDFRDINGQAIFANLNSELQKKPESNLYRFNYKALDESGIETNYISSAIYLSKWNWIIGAVAPESDYLAAKDQMHSQFYDLQIKQFLSGLGVLIFIVIMTLLLVNKLTKPIVLLNRIASKIAVGEISSAKESLLKYRSILKISQKSSSKDDIIQLFNSFSTMVTNLDSLIGQVQKSGIQVTTSATQIAASARELEATIAEQAASTREVNATSKEISGISSQLSDRMNEVKQNVVDTSAVAEKGRENLLNMDKAMSDLTKATILISSKLSVINDKAGKISAIVTTINKISEQTNLLSLNAAIEAEKAGDYGKGFAVVAREISRLADQTAIATKDIEYMVSEMQSSVSSGVMEVDKFGQEVRNNNSVVSDSVDDLNDIIDRVYELTPEFESVNIGMQAQTNNATQISHTMNQLAQVSDQTKDSLVEFKGATVMLNDAVRGLQIEVSKFKIS